MQPHRSNSNPSEEWLQYLRNSQLGGNVAPNEPVVPISTDQLTMARGSMSMAAGDFLPPVAPHTLTTSSRLTELSNPSLLHGVELSLRQQAIHDLYREQRILEVQRLMQQDYLMNWSVNRATQSNNFPAPTSLDVVRRSHWPSMERQLLSPFPVRDVAFDNSGRLSQIVDLLGQVTASRRESPSETVDLSLKQTPVYRSNNSPIGDGKDDEGSDSKPAAKKLKGTSPSSSSPPPGEKAFPSERQNLGDLTAKSHSPSQAQHVLKVLGTTLRCKADPFVDATILPVQASDPTVPKTSKKTRAPGGLSSSFPEVLYELLETADRENLDDIVSWLPHRRAFRVNNKDRFMQEILPRYFKGQNRWSSFLRQLNLYGFSRVAKGPDYGAYYHELFVGGRPDLTVHMHRVGTPKGLDRRTFKLAEGDDPNFYDLTPVEPQSSLSGAPSGSG